jgi:Laminin G domain/Laminin Domain II
MEVEWESARDRIANTSARADEIKTRLSLLADKVQIARDKANRIKLGAHFERGSMLELPIPQKSEDFGFFTSVRFFFRTRDPNGLLFFLGADNSRLAGEYIAVEVENSKPKLLVNFGRDTSSTVLDAKVDDYHWREVVVERNGKRIEIKVEQ